MLSCFRLPIFVKHKSSIGLQYFSGCPMVCLMVARFVRSPISLDEYPPVSTPLFLLTACSFVQINTNVIFTSQVIAGKCVTIHFLVLLQNPTLHYIANIYVHFGNSLLTDARYVQLFHGVVFRFHISCKTFWIMCL